MNAFDSAVSMLDEVQQTTFGESVLIDGVEHSGVYDANPDYYEGVETMHHTFEIPLSDLSVAIENDVTTIKLLSTDSSFTVYKAEPVGSVMMMVLR